MIQSSYYNNKTKSSASIQVDANALRREITIKVVLHDVPGHTYATKFFPPDKYGDALDFYNETVKKMEAA